MQNGKYILNRRAVEIDSTLYPLPYEASPYVMTWQDGIQVSGDIINGIFYPKAQRT